MITLRDDVAPKASKRPRHLSAMYVTVWPKNFKSPHAPTSRPSGAACPALPPAEDPSKAKVAIFCSNVAMVEHIYTYYIYVIYIYYTYNMHIYISILTSILKILSYLISQMHALQLDTQPLESPPSPLETERPETTALTETDAANQAHFFILCCALA